MKPRLNTSSVLSRATRYFKAFRCVLKHPSLLARHEHIFLLTHMRGYTTLLSHILGSHPEVSGYTEAWFGRGRAPYRNSINLLQLRCVVSYHGNYKPKARYVLDKLLHNGIEISDSVLTRDDVRCLFMIRKPEPTIKSIVDLHRRYTKQATTNNETTPPGTAEVLLPRAEVEGADPWGEITMPRTIEAAAGYYRARVEWLADMGEHLHALGKPGLAIVGEDLIDHPVQLLGDIQRFLELTTPLEDRYSTFERTGTWFRGDTSEFISRGNIERNRPEHSDITIPPEISTEVNRAYAKCLARLEQCIPFAGRPTSGT